MSTAIKVAASKLQAGDVVLDPTTGEASIEIDHRQRAVRNSGNVTYFALDYTTHRYADFSFRPRLNLSVIR